MKPIAIKKGITIEELPGEIIAYDLGSHRAHCLNRSAVEIWRCCDGTMTVEEIASRLHQQIGLPKDPELVRLGLEQLKAARLLEVESVEPAADPPPSRRAMSRRHSLAAMAIPVVTSIAVPTAAMAQSRRGGTHPPQPPHPPNPPRPPRPHH
ncbi:MAG: PqqD family protein [Acidobacteria bacterium]|nr:PqqD family protein [Acidobacteriota bacterium]